MIHGKESSSDDFGEYEDRKRDIAQYWNDLSFVDDSGGTTWDVLDAIRTEVTELLADGSRDAVIAATRLTARVEYLRRHGES
jgi:hypothetical protein